MKMIFFNPEVTQGTKLHSICGRSGKVYGKTTYSGKFHGHTFEMSLEDYKKYARDILSNKIALQCWIPFPVLEGSDVIAPAAVGPELALSALLTLLEPHALETDQKPSDTLRRLLDGKAAQPPADPAPVKSANSLTIDIDELKSLSTQKLRSLAKSKGLNVAGMSHPEMIAMLTQ